jgi:hypothetical protein
MCLTRVAGFAGLLREIGIPSEALAKEGIRRVV